MARAIWTGAISFGLVTVPVRVYSATSSHKVAFHQFQEGTGQRIRYQRVAEDSGEEVAYEDIVKGHEVDDGRYVIVSKEELEAIEPGRSRTIEIEDFVRLEDVDPIVWDSTYYLGPQEDAGAEKPYKLLNRAMASTGRVAIGRFVMRSKQYLATIRPMGDLLALETMHFADEVRGVDDVPGVPVEAEPAERELRMAEQLIESLTTDWDLSRYRDTYRDRVLELIERKAKGEEIVVEREHEPAQVADLMEALRASVEASKRERPGGAAAASADGAGPRGDGDGPDGDGLAKLNSDELYGQAKEAGVPGRSKMSKDELVDALRQRKAS